MQELFVAYSLLTAAGTATLFVLTVRRSVRQRRQEQWGEPMRLKYLRIILAWMLSGAHGLPAFPLISRRGARRLLSETVARLAVSTYGLDPKPLKRIVKAHRLDERLLARARSSLGSRRARYLLYLSALPLDADFSARLEPFSRSRRRCVRFYALLARLACDPQKALTLIGAYREPFTPLELSELVALLRRGMLPIAYEPLLEAPDANFRLLGMAIVRQFGIEEAEKQLLRIAANPACGELAAEAVYTLTALHRPVGRPQVAACCARMSAAQRKSLLRYMAREGYAVRALEPLFRGEERPYFEALVDSYKRTIVCS